MIDLRQLRTLQAIQRQGSLSAAAERLHLTQSAISHQLRELEGLLGVPLLERKSKPPRFSPVGQRLLQLADQVLPLVQAAERDLAKQLRGESGRLMMALECHSCFDWLMPALNAFRPHWPEVVLDFRSGFHADAQQLLLEGELDWVVTANPSALPGLVFLPLFPYESVLVLANDHPLVAKAQIAPADLAAETLISYPVSDDRLDIMRHFLMPAGVQPARRRQVELTVMMVQLAANRQGVCALPAWAAAEYVDRGWVTTRPLGRGGIWCTLYAAVRAEDEQRAYVQDLLAIIRDQPPVTGSY